MNEEFNIMLDQDIEKCDKIKLESTSTKTASATQVILKRTEMIQTKFEPTLIDNAKDSKKSVSGKLIFERKSKNDNEFSSEKLSRQSVKVGEIMEISLDSTETF